MRIIFNNCFAHTTFREEVLKLNESVHCLTFQTKDVLDVLNTNGVYRADCKKSIRQVNRHDYEHIVRELGYMPIWVFNPLQFGTTPQTTWQDEWFKEGSLWNRLIQDGNIGRDKCKGLELLEILVEPENLYPDPTFDYGYISVIDKITRDMLLGHYKLEFPDEDSDDWLYPWLYPARDNSDKCSFKETKQYIKIRKPKNSFESAMNLMGGD